jgi:hypothetical protein
VRDDPPVGSYQEAVIAGYREGGSGFNFVPAFDVFRAPAKLRQDDWDLRLRTARTLYGPSYARHFKSLSSPQIYLFRRGDSALVVASYDLRDDTLFAKQGLEAGLFVLPIDSNLVGAPQGTVDTDARSSGVLTTVAPWAPLIVSLELLDTKSKAAARIRVALAPPTSAGRRGISDIVMFAPKSPDSLPHRLADALSTALHTDEIDRNTLLGLFWETYGVREEGESFAIAITIDRVQEGLMRRAAERLHLAAPFSPMTLQWMEVPDRGNGIASRSVTLDVSKLEPGRYEISLSVTPRDGVPMVAKREITLRR